MELSDTLATAFQVSLSAPSLGDCQSVLKIMRQLGQQGDVTSNVSLNIDGSAEPGCRVLLGDANLRSLSKLISHVQSRHPDVKCAHVRSLPHEYEGCVWNILETARNTKCPQSEKNRK